jgi:hypothetical protein
MWLKFKLKSNYLFYKYSRLYIKLISWCVNDVYIYNFEYICKLSLKYDNSIDISVLWKRYVINSWGYYKCIRYLVWLGLIRCISGVWYVNPDYIYKWGIRYYYKDWVLIDRYSGIYKEF